MSGENPGIALHDCSSELHLTRTLTREEKMNYLYSPAAKAKLKAFIYPNWLSEDQPAAILLDHLQSPLGFLLWQPSSTTAINPQARY